LLFGEPAESFVKRQEVRSRLCHGESFVQVDALPVAAVPGPALAPGIVNEDAAHGLGSGREEVPPAVPARLVTGGLTCPGRHQPEVRFMHESRGLERLPRFLMGQPLRRQLAQLVVNKRQELLGSVGVALLNGTGCGSPRSCCSPLNLGGRLRLSGKLTAHIHLPHV
jgi:hypothetical protein